jgi:hypothetical protein
VAHGGIGLGQIFAGGAPVGGPWTVAIAILTDGNASTCQWQTQFNMSAPVTHTATSFYNDVTSGISLTLSDQPGVSPSFKAGDRFFLTAPGTSLVAAGRDIETPQQLGIRCRGLWSLLGMPKDGGTGLPILLSPSAAGYETLLRSCCDQVTQVLVSTSTMVNDRVDLIVAGQGVTLSADTIGAIQLWLTLQLKGCNDVPVVASPTTRPINLRGMTITCDRFKLLAAQQTLQSELQLYLTGQNPQFPAPINGQVQLAVIIVLVAEIDGYKGANTAGFQIGHDGGSYAASDLQLPVSPGAFEQATWSENVANVFTWIPV